MIQLTEEEIWAYNTLDVHVKLTQEELNRAIAAKNAYYRLLEIKYNATLNPETGKLEPNDVRTKNNKPK